MNWKPYPAYKDCGVGWSGEIPTHWKGCKLKYVASAVVSNVDKHSAEGETPVHLCNYINVYNNDFIGPDIDLMEATASSNEIAKFKITKGDVLVTKDSEDWRDIAVSAFVTSDMDRVLCGYHLAQIRPTTAVIDGKYLFRAFSASGINEQFKVAATGITRYGLGKYSLDSALFPVPPLDEQHTIAAFLDRETERIDNLIARKQRQIELLQEKRAALISHAVTRGLDHNVRMKDSGVEWLGEIPEHWEVKRLKHVSHLRSGDSITSFDIYETGDYPVYGGNGLRGYTVAYSHEGEFVLIGRQGALCGCINYAVGRFWASEHAVVATPIGQTVVRWLGELLRSMNLNRYSQSAAQPGLAVETIAALLLPVPPIQEQRSIAAYLDSETGRIDALISKVQQSIEMLCEYRSALISAAVTGKIDVRQEVA